MNRCWTEGWHEEQFREYIHSDAVALVPTTPGRLKGRDACGAGWQGFGEVEFVRKGKETDPVVQFYAYGTIGVITYFLSIMFAKGAQKQMCGAGTWSS